MFSKSNYKLKSKINLLGLALVLLTSSSLSVFYLGKIRAEYSANLVSNVIEIAKLNRPGFVGDSIS